MAGSKEVISNLIMKYNEQQFMKAEVFGFQQLILNEHAEMATKTPQEYILYMTNLLKVMKQRQRFIGSAQEAILQLQQAGMSCKSLDVSAKLAF